MTKTPATKLPPGVPATMPLRNKDGKIVAHVDMVKLAENIRLRRARERLLQEA